MTSPMTQASGLFGLILGLRGVRAYWAYLSEMTRKPRLWEPWSHHWHGNRVGVLARLRPIAGSLFWGALA